MIDSHVRITPHLPAPQPGHELQGWLVEQAQARGLRWLLAFADDGVIWGRFDDGSLSLSGDADAEISPRLRPVTLQQVRLFGEKAEVFLWKTDNGWQARLLEELAEPPANSYLDEPQIVWGTQAEQRPNGFTRLTEKAQSGMRHCVPLAVEQDLLERRGLKLRARHYIGVDAATGEARIEISRLVGWIKDGEL